MTSWTVMTLIGTGKRLARNPNPVSHGGLWPNYTCDLTKYDSQLFRDSRKEHSKSSSLKLPMWRFSKSEALRNGKNFITIAKEC